MDIKKTVLACVVGLVFSAGSVMAQTTQTTTNTTHNTTQDYKQNGSVWIKDSAAAQQYLKSVQGDRIVSRPDTAQSIYQKNGSVWYKGGSVIDKEKGIYCCQVEQSPK